MGLSDRDYTKRNSSDGKKRRPRKKSGRSITVTLIFINVALWLANGLLVPLDITNRLALRKEVILVPAESNEIPLAEQPERGEQKKFVLNPVQCYRFLTYGFAHDPSGIWHIAFNMIGLLMFGYGMMLGFGPNGFGFVRGENVETQLGKQEFLAFYLLTIIIGGIVYALTNFGFQRAGVLGASGGVCGVIILYAWLFPKKTLFLYGIIPLPMWLLGLFIVFMDSQGAAGAGDEGIAYSVHLAGAACGTLYYLLFLKQGKKLTGWTSSAKRPKRKPKLRVHTPEEPPPTASTPEEDFNRRLDTILKRYGEVGESGLTPPEREFLRQASQKFAEKHRK